MKKFTLISTILLFAVLSSFGQWEYTNLSEAKGQMGVAALGTKAYFAGGYKSGPLDKIEIYDVKTGEWRYWTLSAARILPIGVTCGSKVFFAGGAIFPTEFFSEVDIFDTVTQQWTVDYLSEPRFGLSAVSKGNKVLFAGGINLTTPTAAYNVVDIYDTETRDWTTNYLSQPRGTMGSAVVGDLAIFAGGYDNQVTSDRVDIYNFTTGLWDTATLSESRGFVSATTIGNKVLIAGGFRDGFIPSNRVDIYDAVTNTWSIAELSAPRCSENVFATVCGKAFYVGGGSFDGQYLNDPSDVIDVYDSVTNTWSVMNLTAPLVWHSVVAVGDKLLIAGGQSFLEGSGWFDQDLISIYTNPDCIPQGVVVHREKDSFFKIYPNPSSGNFQLEMLNDNHQKPLLVTIYNLQGQEVFTQLMEPGNKVLNVNLPDGVYLLKVISDDATHAELIKIQK